ncbi:unnamed protein product [Moneuplotes crassus]|uniref:Uncharacterized protein n=1 Tax=Euplotes crassus TaxID=5936 RepID=A0AAD1Y7P0_EUPCR|nr:unnamed protein product [Moneuplotes crassus]
MFKNHFWVKKAVLVTVKDDEAKTVSFRDCSFNVGRTTQVKMVGGGFVYVSIADQVYGKVIKEQEESLEVDVKKVFQENKQIQKFSPYPLESITSYGILFKGEDLVKMRIPDPVILKNIHDDELIKNICSADCSNLLKEQQPWTILSPPTEASTQIIPKDCSVEIDIGSSLLVKSLDGFFNLLESEYSHLRIDSLNCFYYLDKERVQSLDNLLKAHEGSSTVNQNERYINKVNLKVAFEEDLDELLEVLGKYPILDINITYDGEVTDDILKKCKQFMVKFFNRNVVLYADEKDLLTPLKHFKPIATEEYEFDFGEDEE